MNTIDIHAPTTLLELLLAHGYSRTKIKQLIKYRALQVDGTAVIQLEQPLVPGEQLTITSAKEAGPKPLHCPGLPIIFEDEDIVVVDKPSGLLTIASDKEKNRTVFHKLCAAMKDRDQSRRRVFVVHRLDRDASGLLVFAKNEAAQHTLQQNWPKVDKRFVAVVEGVLPQGEGKVSGYLAESKIHRMYTTLDREEGKYAETLYQVLETGELYTLVELQLMTARKNQLRVHLADLGHPVAGDRKYGAQADPIKRLAVHANSLVFPHPVSGETLHFAATIPPNFYSLLKASGKKKS